MKGLGNVQSSAPITPTPNDPTTGIGRFVTLSEPYPTLESLIARMKKHFGITTLQLAVRKFRLSEPQTNQSMQTPIRSVAICAGAGDSVLSVRIAEEVTRREWTPICTSRARWVTIAFWTRYRSNAV